MLLELEAVAELEVEVVAEADTADAETDVELVAELAFELDIDEDDVLDPPLPVAAPEASTKLVPQAAPTIAAGATSARPNHVARIDMRTS